MNKKLQQKLLKSKPKKIVQKCYESNVKSFSTSTMYTIDPLSQTLREEFLTLNQLINNANASANNAFADLQAYLAILTLIDIKAKSGDLNVDNYQSLLEDLIDVGNKTIGFINNMVTNIQQFLPVLLNFVKDANIKSKSLTTECRTQITDIIEEIVDQTGVIEGQTFDFSILGLTLKTNVNDIAATLAQPIFDPSQLATTVETMISESTSFSSDLFNYYEQLLTLKTSASQLNLIAVTCGLFDMFKLTIKCCE